MGPNHKKLTELPTKSAANYFDNDSEKEKVKEVISGAFKPKQGKDYEKKLYGYTLRDFLASTHNPYII